MVFTLQPVYGKSIIGREKIINEMLRVLEDKRSNTGYALYGGRRVGKTSILKELESILAPKRDYVVIYIPLWEIIPFNIETFLEELITATLENYKSLLSLKYQVKELMKTPIDILKTLVKNLKLSVKIQDDIEFLLSFKQRRMVSYTNLFKKAFSLPEQLARETNTKCILILDEFPTILDIKDGITFVRALRTLHEGQKKVAFCIAGSIRKTMDAVILSESAPFYKQFLIKKIQPLDIKGSTKLLKLNCKEYKIKIDKEAINEFYEYTKGVPFYLQFLGKLSIAQGIKHIDLKNAKKIILMFLTEEGNTIFMEQLHSFSAKEQNILGAIASKDLESVTQISRETRYAPNKVSTYLLYLIDKGALEKKERGKYMFVDNMFKEWLKMRV